MRIENFSLANSQNGGMNRKMATDSVSKNIQNQIANAQKQLQELSANENMSAEEKMKKRQEIQQQITDLNNQLRQHQIEQRKEKQQVKSSSNDNMVSSNKKGNQGTGLSQSSMTAIISADSAISHARVQNNVADRLEARAGVLKSEIKLDSSRGGSVEAKQEELAKVEERAAQVSSGQMSTLLDVNIKMEKPEEKREVAGSEKEQKETKEKDITKTTKRDIFTFGHVDVHL